MCASTYDLLFVERLERAALNDEKQEIHRTALNSQLTLLESTHIHLITTTYTHVLSHLLFVQDAHPRSLPRCCKCENKLGSITDGLKPLFNPEKKKKYPGRVKTGMLRHKPYMVTVSLTATLTQIPDRVTACTHTRGARAQVHVDNSQESGCGGERAQCRGCV